MHTRVHSPVRRLTRCLSAAPPAPGRPALPTPHPGPPRARSSSPACRVAAGPPPASWPPHPGPTARPRRRLPHPRRLLPLARKSGRRKCPERAAALAAAAAAGSGRERPPEGCSQVPPLSGLFSGGLGVRAARAPGPVGTRACAGSRCRPPTRVSLQGRPHVAISDLFPVLPGGGREAAATGDHFPGLVTQAGSHCFGQHRGRGE